MNQSNSTDWKIDYQLASKNKKGEEKPLQLCKFVTDYRTFMKDFLKVVDFVHYLRAEGYDMVTFDKVGNGVK